MAFKRPKVDSGGGDHLSAIINGTRVALLRELLASLLGPPYGQGFGCLDTYMQGGPSARTPELG